MSPSKPVPTAPLVTLALGSNLGDRRRQLQRAVAALRARGPVDLVAVSALYATAAVGIAAGPEFLNAALALRTPLAPEALLALCQQLEAEAGRTRQPGQWTSRPLDLDLLSWEGYTRGSPELTLPHPRLQERGFVLAPLNDVAPALLIRGRTVAEWLKAADLTGVRRLAGGANWASL
jgi:2-amino-4-hydroxy-6-hydroxymethyldihydropteridine diphosphokinase